MLKKIPAVFLAIYLGSHGVAFANESTSTSQIKTATSEQSTSPKNEIDYNSPFFKNAELSDVAKKHQKASIKKLDEKYFSIENYNQEELNELFTSFISLGMNDAADYILNNKKVKIDLERYSEQGLTPLMASAIAPIEGGNVEYAKKLIDLGVDINKGTKNTDITPTSLASNVNNYKVVGILIFNGALFMKEDKLNFRPIDYALRNNSVESAKIIKEALTEQLKSINNK